jgi:hypothetical protein
MIREAEAIPAGNGMLFPCAILVAVQYVLFSIEVPLGLLVVLIKPVSQLRDNTSIWC